MCLLRVRGTPAALLGWNAHSRRQGLREGGAGPVAQQVCAETTGLPLRSRLGVYSRRWINAQGRGELCAPHPRGWGAKQPGPGQSRPRGADFWGARPWGPWGPRAGPPPHVAGPTLHVAAALEDACSGDALAALGASSGSSSNSRTDSGGRSRDRGMTAEGRPAGLGLALAAGDFKPAQAPPRPRPRSPGGPTPARCCAPNHESTRCCCPASPPPAAGASRPSREALGQGPEGLQRPGQETRPRPSPEERE